MDPGGPTGLLGGIAAEPPVTPANPINAAPAPADPATLPFSDPKPVQSGQAPERPDDPSEAQKAEVAKLWRLTGDTPEWQRFTRQLDRDTATIMGEAAGEQVVDEQKETEDRATVMTRHVYRNSVQAMALTVPKKPEFTYEPERQAPAFSDGGTQIPDSDGVSPELTAFATYLTLLVKRLMRESHAHQGFRGWYQDSHHYEVAWLKVSFQREYAEDPLTTSRLPDDQDIIAKAQTMLERYERNEFTENDAEYREMNGLFETVTNSQEVVIWRGLVVCSIPARQVRIDPRIKRAEDWRRADWIRHDLLMTRDEVLDKYRRVNPDDLGRATVYNANGQRQGNDLRQQDGANQLRPVDNAGAPIGQAVSSGKNINDWDLLLVCEIWLRKQRKFKVLVEGLDYFAAEVTPEFTPSSFYPFYPLILNRAPGDLRFAGLSDTENQAKLQDEMNQLATDEMFARRAAEFRFLYDKDAVQDDTLGRKVRDLRAFEGLGISFDGRDIEKIFFGLPGNAQANPQLYDRNRIQSDLRSMSGLPEQFTGGTGAVDFAAQIDVAAQGATALANFRREIIGDSTVEVGDGIAQLVLYFMEPEEVAELLGPNVLSHWPASHPDRMTLYRKLSVRTAVSFGQNMNKKAIIDGIELLLSTAKDNGQPADVQKAMEVIGRALDLPEDIDQIIKLDPNSLALRLVSALGKSPDQISPQVLQQLSQVLMPLIQQALAAQTQQLVAAHRAGQPPLPIAAGPAGPGGPMPPRPMPPGAPGRPAPGAPPPQNAPPGIMPHGAPAIAPPGVPVGTGAHPAPPTP